MFECLPALKRAIAVICFLATINMISKMSGTGTRDHCFLSITGVALESRRHRQWRHVGNLRLLLL